MYILSVASVKYHFMEFMNVPARVRNLGKKDKCVATVITRVAILNTGLRIACVLSSLNSAETELSVILPYLMARVLLMSLGEVMLFWGKFGVTPLHRSKGFQEEKCILQK